jgi:hypothetical protein
MNLLCRLIGHRRSASEARRYSNSEWRSVCRNCRLPLIRIGPNHWVPVEDHPAGTGADG